MDLNRLGVVVDAVGALVFAGVAASILSPLRRSGRLRQNRLDLAAALVFSSSAVGHAIRFGQELRDPPGRDGDGYLAAWTVLTVLLGAAYLRLRRAPVAAEEGGGLYEDTLRRQHELAGQVMAANVREDLATERAGAAEQRLARVLAAAPIGMAVVDRHGGVTSANAALARILGLGGATEAGTDITVPLGHLFSSPDRPQVEALLVEGGASGGLELSIERPDGAPRRGRLTITPLADDDGSLLVQVEDVTTWRQAEERLEHLTLHDGLTGLPNRQLFDTRVTAALRQANRTGCYVGCLLVDLDHFKAVNDSVGHAAGDGLLVCVAARLADVVRPGDTVARIGGDEFCLLLVGLEHQAEGEVVARRVQASLDCSVEIDGLTVTTSASIGVAVARPGDRATSETLVRDAETALGRAKRNGRARTVVFDPEPPVEVLRRVTAEARLAAS